MRQYKELVNHILDTGEKREDRTGVGTRSVFGTQSRYDLQKGFPLVTTKKVNFKAIVAELLWFLSGSTNTNDLDSTIWDEWADGKGELGPIYGQQWRHFGARFNGIGNHGSGYWTRGIDQIQQAIHTIKTNPTSRRIIVSAWNPMDIPEMALPPCHMMFQFYVRKGEFLDCQMYQRSADVALGAPFNIASYALLTQMVANECGLYAGELVHTIGDAHAYENHVDGLRMQMKRVPWSLPELYLAPGKSVLQITAEDIELLDYCHGSAIKFEVAV